MYCFFSLRIYLNQLYYLVFCFVLFYSYANSYFLCSGFSGLILNSAVTQLLKFLRGGPCVFSLVFGRSPILSS